MTLETYAPTGDAYVNGSALEGAQRSAVTPGSLIEMESDGTIWVTPELAARWLEEWRFDGQRPIRKTHVTFLASEIRTGNFRRSVLDVRTCDGRVYLINGQHRLKAVVEAGTPVRMGISALSCETMQQVRADYAIYDRGLVRSYVDAMSAYDMIESTGLNRDQLKRISTASSFIAIGFRPRNQDIEINMRSALARVRFVQTWSEPALLAFATLGEGTPARMRRVYTGPIFATILVMFRYQPEAAEVFWRRVVENDGLRKGDPERALMESLMSSESSGGYATRLPRVIATAWNARRENRSIQFIRIGNPNAPIRLAGTPYDGKRHYRINMDTMLIDTTAVTDD